MSPEIITPPKKTTKSKPKTPQNIWQALGDALVRNWATTASGIIAGAAAFVVANPGKFPEWTQLPAALVASGALASLGISAKQSNVSHTQRDDEEEPPK